MEARKTPKFWLAVQPTIIRLYKAAGLVALTAILIGLLGFLIVNIFYFFDHTWVRPVVLSPTHQKVVEASNQLNDDASAIYLSLVDRAMRQLLPDQDTLTVRTTCTRSIGSWRNRILPREMRATSSKSSTRRVMWATCRSIISRRSSGGRSPVTS